MFLDNLAFESVQCPYCGEQIDVEVDCSVDEQVYIEDCSVCCRPITCSVTAFEGELITLTVGSEND